MIDFITQISVWFLQLDLITRIFILIGILGFSFYGDFYD